MLGSTNRPYSRDLLTRCVTELEIRHTQAKRRLLAIEPALESGLWRGEAPPTARQLALRAAIELVVERKEPTVYLSVFNSRLYAALRMLETLAEIRLADFQRGSVSDLTFARVTVAAGKMAVAPIVFAETPFSMENIIADLKRHAKGDSPLPQWLLVDAAPPDGEQAHWACNTSRSHSLGDFRELSSTTGTGVLVFR